MTNTTHSSDEPRNAPFIFIGCFLGIAFWIIEAYFDSLMIDNTSFQQRLFPSDPNELWMRGFICALFVSFGLYAHIITTRMRSVESMNLDAALLLRNALSKTIRGNFPICVYCKKIRDEDGLWTNPDRFIAAQTEAQFSGSICNTCHDHRANDRAATEKPGNSSPN